jgi:hypothetical protein
MITISPTVMVASPMAKLRPKSTEYRRVDVPKIAIASP